MKKTLSTILFAFLVFVGTAIFAQEKATIDVTETFASEYMPDTKAFLDQIQKIRATDEALFVELYQADCLIDTPDYPNGAGLKNDAMGLLARKIRAFLSREEMIVKTLKDLYFKHQAELVEAEDLAAKDAALAKDGAAWFVNHKDCKKMYSFRDVAPDLNANYLVIDLDTFSKTSLSEPPANGWSDAFKTDALVLRKVGDFWLGVFEVTQGQWEMVMGRNPSQFSDKPDSPVRPVENVSWDDSMVFCMRLTAETGIKKFNLVFRFPLESQWERAAKGDGVGHKYSGSDDYDEVAWFDCNSDNQTHAVGTKEPNELGIYDMSGNVWEWCLNQYEGGAYTRSCFSGTWLQCDGKGLYRGLSGGSWVHNEDCNLENGNLHLEPSCSNKSVGFRAALVPVP